MDAQTAAYLAVFLLILGLISMLIWAASQNGLLKNQLDNLKQSQARVDNSFTDLLLQHQELRQLNKNQGSVIREYQEQEKLHSKTWAFLNLGTLTSIEELGTMKYFLHAMLEALNEQIHVLYIYLRDTSDDAHTYNHILGIHDALVDAHQELVSLLTTWNMLPDTPLTLHFPEPKTYQEHITPPSQVGTIDLRKPDYGVPPSHLGNTDRYQD